MRSLFYWGGGAALIFVACATSTSPNAGGSGDSDDAGNTPIYDAGNNTQVDSGAGPCTLGSADHCGTCDTVCPGASDAGGTTRVCSDSTTTATCDIICTGEWYDVNGVIADGCEAQDPIVHDSADAAVPETAPAGGNTVAAPLWYAYGDARMHDVAPVARPTGREDWYVLSNQNGTPQACLTIVNFPPDDMFEVCITNEGNQNIENTQCKTVTPDTTTTDTSTYCVSPSLHSNGGSYWVRVRKISGANTLDGYALFLKQN
jgi:hypothetical protein